MRRYAVTLAAGPVGPAEQTLEVDIDDVDLEVPGAVAGVTARALRVVVAGQERTLIVSAVGPQRFTWLDGPRVVTALVDASVGATKGGAGKPTDGPAAQRVSVVVGGQTFTASVTDARAAEIPVVSAPGRTGAPVVVRAPMPGRVIKLIARVGDVVVAGAGLVVVEAMKMENELRAPRDGRVTELKVAEGAVVESGQDLVVVE